MIIFSLNDLNEPRKWYLENSNSQTKRINEFDVKNELKFLCSSIESNQLTSDSVSESIERLNHGVNNLNAQQIHSLNQLIEGQQFCGSRQLHQLFIDSMIQSSNCKSKYFMLFQMLLLID